MEMKVRDLMTSPVQTVTASQSILAVHELMRERCVHHIPVIEGNRVIGIVSDRDTLAAQLSSLTRISEERRSQLNLPVPVMRVMTHDPVTVGLDTPAYVAVQLMVDRRVSALPVLDEEEKLIGIVTKTDLLRVVLETLERQHRESNP